ncbi:cation-translocating P-type ATPase [Methylobacterium sp. P31]
MRLSIGGLKRAPDRATLLERGLSTLPGIRSVSASSLTGNVIVHHEPAIAVSVVSEWISALLHGETTPVDDALQTSWYSETAEGVARALHSDAESGLTSQEASARLVAGANTLPPPRRRSSWSIFAGQFESLPVLMLVGAGAISVFTGAFLEAAAIAGVVALNGAIGFRTESQTERTIESLDLPEALSAQAIRDGIARTVKAEELVTGDLILLRRGMIVPADARLVTAQALTISEAALTGESLPVAKTTSPLARLDMPLADRTNMVYRGTAVTGGSGMAIVVAIGGRTEVGRIQHLVGAVAAPATPLQRSLEDLGRRLVWMTLAAGALIFGIGLLRGFSPLQILRLALATAVAAVPEGLPMVATSTLALGVGALRRRNVFVRRLDAIETLAAADVICFDKTGTLTLGSMSVDAVAVAGRSYKRHELDFRDQDGNPADSSDGRIGRLLAIGSLCSEVSLERREDRLVPVGSPTETALLQAALDVGLDVQGLRRDFPLRTVQHRTEAYRFMATVHCSASATFIAVKGNPAEVLARCSHEALPGGTVRFSPYIVVPRSRTPMRLWHGTRCVCSDLLTGTGRADGTATSSLRT